jgi:hypothetical protein
MKSIKMIVSSVAILFSLVTSLSFAQPSMTNLHAEKQSTQKNLKAKAHHATEIDVINNSNRVITVKVPGTNIYDSIYPHEIEELWSDVYFDEVEVVLYDEAGYEFFRQFVPNHSQVYVDNLLASGQAKAKTKVSATVKKS